LHRDVLDPHHPWLAFAPVAVERVAQRREGTHELVAVLQPQLAAREGLLGQGGAAEARHGGLVRRHHLRRQHRLDHLARADLGQGGSR
jgi:hypothetical protein